MHLPSDTQNYNKRVFCVIFIAAMETNKGT